MFAVLKKELKNYLLSPIGYIFVGLFILIFSLLYYVSVFSSNITNFEYVFYDTATILTFVTPVLTMRMFAEERRNGTEQLLLTSPRSTVSIVLGKFFAALVMILITIVFTLIHLGILAYFGTVDFAIAGCTLLGFFLLSAAYISFGMFASSVTENQIIACVLTIGVFMAMWFLPSISDIFSMFSLISMFNSFPSGVIALDEVIMFVSFSVLFILLTIIVLQRRKSVG